MLEQLIQIAKEKQKESEHINQRILEVEEELNVLRDKVWKNQQAASEAWRNLQKHIIEK
jgi:hypothetical protein